MINPTKFLQIFPHCPICNGHLFINNYKYSNSISCNGYDEEEDSFHEFSALFIKDDDFETVIMFQFQISDDEFIVEVVERENNTLFAVKETDVFADSEHGYPSIKEIELPQLPNLQDVVDHLINKQIESLIII